VLDDGGKVGGVRVAAGAVEGGVAGADLGEGGGAGGEVALQFVQGGDGAPREVGEGDGGSLGLEEGEDLLAVGGSHDALQCSALVEGVALEGRHGGWEGDVGEGGAVFEGPIVDLVDFRVGEVDALKTLAPGESGTSREAGRGVSGGAFVCCV
jgi:hypothetical protein